MINYSDMNTTMPASPVLPAWISRSIFGALVFGAPALTWALVHHAGLGTGVAVSISVLFSGLILMSLEWRYPLHASWTPSPAMFKTDLMHCLISTPLPPLLIASFAVGALQEIMARMAVSGSVSSFWPASWPLFLQVGFGLFLSEFGAYWIHRTCHLNRFFWRIHALHHSPRLLHTLASGRNHPFNVIAIYSARVLPLVALGAGSEVLAAISTLNGVHGMLQHVNLDIRAGVLNYLFAGPELHHRHHSLVLVDSRTNFGNILIVWDLIFGTFKYSPNDRMGPGVGVHELEVPEKFMNQILLPFELSRWERPELAERGVALTRVEESA
jgi:sterol desaturase/sphingolipid hydroxylase (fatty acid hydroxylase superfamily)